MKRHPSAKAVFPALAAALLAAMFGLAVALGGPTSPSSAASTDDPFNGADSSSLMDVLAKAFTHAGSKAYAPEMRGHGGWADVGKSRVVAIAAPNAVHIRAVNALLAPGFTPNALSNAPFTPDHSVTLGANFRAQGLACPTERVQGIGHIPLTLDPTAAHAAKRMPQPGAFSWGCWGASSSRRLISNPTQSSSCKIIRHAHTSV